MDQCCFLNRSLHCGIDFRTNRMRASNRCFVAFPCDFKLVKKVALIERMERSIEPCSIFAESRLDIAPRRHPRNTAHHHLESEFLPPSETCVHALTVEGTHKLSAESGILSGESRLSIVDEAGKFGERNRPVPEGKPEGAGSAFHFVPVIDQFFTCIEDERKCSKPL